MSDLILGVDPGSRKAGFGVVSFSGGRLTYITSGCIRMADADLSVRLVELYEGIQKIIMTYQPHRAVIEDVFMGGNWRSALTLGQARGVLMLAAGQSHVTVSAMSPRAVKKAVTGSGAASKGQVSEMVVRLLGLGASPQEDAADALALAIAGAHVLQVCPLNKKSQ